MNRIPLNAVHLATVVLCAVFLAACGGDSSGPSKAGPPVALNVVSGDAQEGQAGQALAQPVTVQALDKNQRGVQKAVVTFSVTSGNGTVSAQVDTTDANGAASVTWTMGSQLGAAKLEARVTGLVVPAVFNAVVKAGPASAVEQTSGSVGTSAGGFDVLDSIAVRVVDRFQHPIANATVNFAVVAGGGSVSSASKTTGDDGIARTAWRLGAGGAQSLRASSGGFETTITGNAVTCPEQTIGLGDGVTFTPGTPACVVLNGSAQRFIVTVVNTASTAGSASGFRFRGSGAAPQSIMSATTKPAPVARELSPANAALVAQERARADAHADIMRANAALLDQRAPARKAELRKLRADGMSIVQSTPLPNLGDILTVRIPSFQNLCSLSLAGAPIGARVAYIGAHAVILEDTLAPLRAQNDAVYATLGQEFDNVMWPILTTNFGNPLAMDAQLDNNARLFMLFSPKINTIQGGTIAGFVSSGDFFPATGAAGQSCGASNFGEFFYARVPNEAGSGFTPGNGTVTPEEWLRETRTVIIHEVKHITSFAEKFASPDIVSNTFFSQDAWIEESTAMIAEELWARGIFGYGIRGNVNYQASIYCEVRPDHTSAPECRGKPVSMFDHFFWLSKFALDTETHSPIGSPSDDTSVYGSGWLFVRWLLDNAVSETAFLSATTRETQRPGTQGVEARTGKSFSELIADWGAAIALDDYPNFTPSNPKHRVQSWNVRDIYSRLNVDFPNTFTQPYPLRSRSAGFGQFLIDIAAVRGGGMAVFEISGTQSAKQLLEFKGSVGTELPADFRVTVTRVQ